MTGNSLSAELEAFEHHLDAFGADEAGWPEAARLRFSTLQSREPRARVLLAEARALDRLLDHASFAEAAVPEAFADRIVAAAASANAASAQGTRERVIEFRPRTARAPVTATIRREAGWRVAALLAASLVAGVFIGTARPVSTAVQSLAQNTVLTSENDVLNVALFEDTGPWPGSLDDEDAL
jgi:hypothetical protein